MSAREAIRDREFFVENLGILLSQTREYVCKCELIDAEKATEHVNVIFKNGVTRRIETSGDSYAAIIKDVMTVF